MSSKATARITQQRDNQVFLIDCEAGTCAGDIKIVVLLVAMPHE
jgi:hypothetical protein